MKKQYHYKQFNSESDICKTFTNCPDKILVSVTYNAARYCYVAYYYTIEDTPEKIIG